MADMWLTPRHHSHAAGAAARPLDMPLRTRTLAFRRASDERPPNGRTVVTIKHHLFGLTLLMLLLAPLAPLILFADTLLPPRTISLAVADVVGVVIYLNALSTVAGRLERV